MLYVLSMMTRKDQHIDIRPRNGQEPVQQESKLNDDLRLMIDVLAEIVVINSINKSKQKGNCYDK